MCVCLSVFVEGGADRNLGVCSCHNEMSIFMTHCLLSGMCELSLPYTSASDKFLQQSEASQKPERKCKQVFNFPFSIFCAGKLIILFFSLDVLRPALLRMMLFFLHTQLHFTHIVTLKLAFLTTIWSACHWSSWERP